MLAYQDKGNRFRYFTKQKILKSNWNGHRVKPQSSSSAEINAILDSIENEIASIIREGIFNKKYYSVNDVKNRFLKKTDQHKFADFLNCYDLFIKKSSITKSPLTIKAYKSTKNLLCDYSTRKSIPLKFETMNKNFYNELVEFLITEKNMLNNSIGKHIKTLKTFLNYCAENEIISPVKGLSGFKVFSEENDIVYLNNEELLKLYRIELLNPTLTKVKDAFCFACFTGLRYSDVQKLTKSNINGGFLELRSQKTKTLLKIPLNEYAVEILHKYHDWHVHYLLPANISNQKANMHLKNICRLSGINKNIEIEKFSGSRKIVIQKEKWELVSTHTARRTFVTLALEKGLRAEVVMSITGHRSYSTFKKYIKITDTVMKRELDKLWNRSTLSVA